MNDNVEKIDLNRVDWKSSREFFESLGEALNKLEDKDESYDFTWVGKRKSIIEAGAPIDKILRPDVEASKDFDNTKNMLIVGDNLDALKLLQESYLGKIKMIYIDPPYNTGHDFVYHDNFTVKKADFEDNSTDSDGNVIISGDEYAENSKANGRFHSDWLSMMYPRLKLARNLLTDDGVIFISIDDNEQANLKKLCDDVFGEDNFIGNIAWESKTKSQNTKTAFDQLQPKVEHIFCYSKSNEKYHFNLLVKAQKIYDKEDEKGVYREYPLEVMNANGVRGRESMIYEIEGITPPDGKQWKLGHDQVAMFRDNGNLFIRNNKIILKMRPGYERSETTEPFWAFLSKEIGTAESAKKELNSILGEGHGFETVKPTSLIERLIFHASCKDSLILDFFSGSGTTGHAVMDLNAEDGGKRQYICVQLDEKTDEKSEARKAGYDTIDQITAERLRRAGEKIKSEYPEADIDTGFRVFRVDGSNDNENIRKPLNEIDQSDMFDMIDNVKKDRTPLDLLFGVIYTSALPFDLKLETRKIGENTVYMYGYLDENTGLIACFDDEVPEETVKEIAKLNPLTAAFKDSSFKNSAEKINLSEHFRIISPDTRVKVI
jgi:type III restriction-modification system ecoP15I, modification subunit